MSDRSGCCYVKLLLCLVAICSETATAADVPFSKKLDERDAGKAFSTCDYFEYSGGVVLNKEWLKLSKQQFFYGFSAIAVDESGDSFYALSDAAEKGDSSIFKASLIYGNDSLLESVGFGSMEMLRRNFDQCEGVVRLKNDDCSQGFLVIAEDGDETLHYYSKDFVFEKKMKIHGLKPHDANGNRAVEAAASLGDGKIVLFGEACPYRIYVCDQYGSKVEFVGEIREMYDFDLSGATSLPDGSVLLLGVYWEGPGNHCIIRLARLSFESTDSLLKGYYEVSVIGDYGNGSNPVIDRFEGVSSRLDSEDEKLWIYLISDDNNKPHQRTIILSLRTKVKFKDIEWD